MYHLMDVCCDAAVWRGAGWILSPRAKRFDTARELLAEDVRCEGNILTFLKQRQRHPHRDFDVRREREN